MLNLAKKYLINYTVCFRALNNQPAIFFLFECSFPQSWYNFSVDLHIPICAVLCIGFSLHTAQHETERGPGPLWWAVLVVFCSTWTLEKLHPLIGGRAGGFVVYLFVF